MTGLRAAVLAVLVVGLVGTTAAASSGGRGHHSDARILIRDDCDAADPAWDEVGGCTRKRGNVDTAEFDEELDSPLADAVIGHQAWRNDPPYLVIKQGENVRIKNVGGRPHTFTEVADFGGGVVPPLNEGLDFATECANLAVLPPGAKTKVSDLPAGNHRFLCCFHPWMRALIKVEARKKHKH